MRREWKRLNRQPGNPAMVTANGGRTGSSKLDRDQRNPRQMNGFHRMGRRIADACVVLVLLVVSVVCVPSALAQKTLPVPSPTTAIPTNHRLILKDGNYQLVRKYEIVGDRVRYISIERSGDWEELPVDLVDWDATRKWERDHATEQPAEAASPAMKEAEAIDKEESAERDEAIA